MRDSGIETVGDVSWGTHFCQFYWNQEDLMELLVPYLEAGLENNEFCLWVISQPSEIEAAKETLRRAVHDIDSYLEKKQIEIVSYSQGDVNAGTCDLEKILGGWIEKLNQALNDGYDGLRLIEDISWAKKESCDDFPDFEKELDGVIGDLPIIGLCTYPLENCSATEVIDAIRNHQIALIRKEGKWEKIENSTSKKKKDELQFQIFANLVDSSDDAIITESFNGIIKSWNRGAERIYGYSAKEIVGKPVSDLELPMLFEEKKELNELIQFEEKIHHYETLHLRKDGKLINVSLTLAPISNASGKPIAVLSIARDITQFKSLEERLRKSEEVYKLILEQTGQIMYEYDFETDKYRWEGAIEEVTGYSHEYFQMLGKFFWFTNIEFLNKNTTDGVFLGKKKTRGDNYKEEIRLRKKDGTYLYAENRGIYFKDNEGYPYKAIGVIKDITDWKLAVKTVKESEEKYRSFISNFSGIIYRHDENFDPVFINGAVEEITGYNENDFMTWINWKDIILPDDASLVLNEVEKIRKFQSKGYGNIEYRIIRRDGRVRWVHEIYQKISKADEMPEFYQGTIYDVTERKEAEELLENFDIFRKKEIHHRIKNNLQVISSLLDLQAEKFKGNECIKDSEVLEAFEESQNRVISMSLIHEELYKGGAIDTLDFSAYLKKLAEKLFQTYILNSKDLYLNMDLEENAFFDMDIAVPLGIIVNELISNSIKYAFTEGAAGEIGIGLSRKENNNGEHKSLFNLKVSDNGKGIPENIDLENVESLGLQLVSILVDQLDGEIELKRDHGTEFSIVFEVDETSNQ